jgi:hypothetical protein
VKALHFSATADTSSPSVARALASRAEDALRPLASYLSTSIRSAQQRQSRSELRWERAREIATLVLEPLDTIVRVTRSPALVLLGWPAERAPDLSQQAFVTARGAPVVITRARACPEGLVFETSGTVSPGERLLFCGHEGIVAEEMGWSPSQARDASGSTLRLRGDPTLTTGGEWLIRLEGSIVTSLLVIDGEELAVAPVAAGAQLSHVRDATGRRFEVEHGELRGEELPAGDLLHGDDELRYRWRRGRSTRQSHWIQLLPTAGDDGADAAVDPRAAFCDGMLEEVWTAPRWRDAQIHKVRRVDAERYQLLLDRLPAVGTTLHLPINLHDLRLQERAVRQLQHAPLPHHRALLRLCEPPEATQWPPISDSRVDEWKVLRDPSRDGTSEQRRFVEKALGTPDLAFLEGPPGSGKTTAICELVLQLASRGQRVLLCGSTHFAIDNVLERLVGHAEIDAARIGKEERVDSRVAATRLEARAEQIQRAWRADPRHAALGDAELRAMAERAVVMAANLTCGTTAGIVRHPLFAGADGRVDVSTPIARLPHWDVLIVDEASKTLVAELLVPALMCRRWVIVGDVRQLPPFTDRESLTANLRELSDPLGRAAFPPDHQRACLLLSRLLRGRCRQETMQWLLVEPPGVLDWIVRELEAQPELGLRAQRVVRTHRRTSTSRTEISVDELRSEPIARLRLAAADWVLVGDDLVGAVADLLPPRALLATGLTAGGRELLAPQHPFFHRHAHSLERAAPLGRAYRDKSYGPVAVSRSPDVEACESQWLRSHDLAGELAWRLTRRHELRRSKSQRERERLRDQLDDLLPRAVRVDDAVRELQAVGLPSVLEVLQDGVEEPSSSRRSALTVGLGRSLPSVFAARSQTLSFQHRMHPEIAAFPREIFYEGEALRDANTITERDESLGLQVSRHPSRRMWIDVRGSEHGGENLAEVQAIESELRALLVWARHHGPPRRGMRRWEIACLSFYVGQERALSSMIKRLTGVDAINRFVAKDAPVEIVCATVDRFQGREADVVLLSMRNTGRIGFLDSPNRLNVGLTRARQELLVVGHGGYFERCGVRELEQLVSRTRRLIGLEAGHRHGGSR